MFDFTLHSPVQELHYSGFKSSTIKIFVKRDDLIHPYISGNKGRKLTYLLKDAEQKGYKNIVTFGGAYSNHLIATACAGALFGFKTTGFVRGEKTEPLNDTLFLCTQFGMQLIYVDRDTYRNKKNVFETHFSQTTHYLISEGGEHALAVNGVAELVTELDNHFTHIFCACGTGTTLAGIAKGVHQHKLKTAVEGVAVLKGADFLHQTIQNYTHENGYKLHLDFHEGGYAKTTTELLAFMVHFQKETGILLDPVYTGKLFFAFSKLIQTKYFPIGSSILLIHTGGLLGTLGMKDKF